MSGQQIVIRGAREHNLKNLDLTIPRDQLVVITGLSGSGKSSLAFDTLYAEGQRRYVESLSAYARQFLDQMEKPDVEYIEGLSPAISIEQKSTSRNPRSTVGTVTEIYDYLRLLFARIGTPHCPKCGREIAAQSAQEITERILAFPEGTRVHLLAPLVRGRKGEYRQVFEQVRRAGYVRVRVDGEVRELDEDITLAKTKRHDIDVVVDRLVVKPGLRGRLADSVETTLRLGQGLLRAVHQAGARGKEHEVLFSEQFACVTCGVSIEELMPRMFSFNSPHGACTTCTGLGTTRELDPDLVVQDPHLSIRAGALAPIKGLMGGSYHMAVLRNVAAHYKFSLDTPWKKLPKRIRTLVLHGAGEDTIEFHFKGKRSEWLFKDTFMGVLRRLMRRYDGTDSEKVREYLEGFMTSTACPDCHGARLRPESLAVRLGGLNIREVTCLSVRDGAQFFDKLHLTKTQHLIADRVLKEVRERLAFLNNVGLEYLTLDRAAGTLSGGEAQRIRLATQIGSGLVGVLYILDEPSIGLHQRDNRKLLDTLCRLRDLGNTVIVVEHDRDTIETADHVIDLGPGAGVNGGEVVAQGTPSQIARSKQSLTGQYLAGTQEIPVPEARRPPTAKTFGVRGAGLHNLRDIDVNFPLGRFVCVTGVSGSGKSSLINHTLYPALAHHLYKSRTKAGPHRRLTGLQHFDKVIDIDQSPIGRTPRSNPATYTGLFTPVREIFTRLPEARVRGYKPGRFSFNVKGGRCEVCQGDGLLKIEMHFLPDVYVTCETCRGHRYNRETLEVRYKGKSIADVLDMPVQEAYAFFSNVPKVAAKLRTLDEVGLGYIRLGQSSTTLSGGEAQRVKLATELSKRGTGRTLYLLDEPTTGLHFDDVKKLLAILHRLVDAGNTVVVIEHNLDVIKTADWIIDLGPEGGEGGGAIVAQGTPEMVAASPDSYTGRFLRTLVTPADTNGRARRPRKGRRGPAKKRAPAAKRTMKSRR